ncbi:MAG: hypothetical protein AAF065_11315 [Verrucomicrobiota bacterium]
MQILRVRPNFKLSRPTICLFAVVGLFFTSTSLLAQRGGPNANPRSGMERIEQEEGARRLAEFRNQRLQGDYVFEFQLEHKPRRARTVRFEGTMWGTWNEKGALSRFKILSEEKSPDGTEVFIELIVQNGFEPRAWVKRTGSDKFVLLEGDALFEPILDGPLYSVFDLQMPFIYWSDFLYEGPARIGTGRVVQRFLMLPPEGSQSDERGIKGVRIGLDDTYNALRRIEVIDEDGSVQSRFAVESFKKVQEQYIVKTITLTNYPEKDRTSFKVIEASVGLNLDKELFDVSLSQDIEPAVIAGPYESI